MHEQNPWKTPFGKLLIGSSIVALVIGFSLAAGFAGYFRTQASSSDENVSQPAQFSDGFESADTFVERSENAPDQPSLVADPEGYAATLDELEPAATSGGDRAIAETSAEPAPPDNASDAVNVAEATSSEGY